MNLLPWRQRLQQKRQIYIFLSISSLVLLVLAFSLYNYILNQDARNFEQEIQHLAEHKQHTPVCIGVLKSKQSNFALMKDRIDHSDKIFRVAIGDTLERGRYRVQKIMHDKVYLKMQAAPYTTIAIKVKK